MARNFARWRGKVWHGIIDFPVYVRQQKSYNYLALILEWRSILVTVRFPEGGPKNPSKGTSMKFLVSARDAQSWVGAGS